MDLITKSALAPTHSRLKELSDETGETVIDLALLELHQYSEALRVTRAVLADALGRAGYHWQADPGRVRLQVSL
jgi:hypothetical protein